MKIKIFTVFDSKAEAYLQPFFMQSKGKAIRAIQNTLEDPNTDLSKYPEDFTLFEIGEYDDQDASITMLEAKVNLGNCLELSNKGS